MKPKSALCRLLPLIAVACMPAANAADLPANTSGTISGTYDNAQIGYRVTGITNTVNSGTSLSIGSGSSNYLLIGTGYNSGNGGGILNVSAADSFTANVGLLWVGISTGTNPIGTGSSTTGGTGSGTLNLGALNTITATQFQIGGNNVDNNPGYSTGSGTVDTIAGGSTTINTAYMAMGTGKGTTGSFTLGSNHTLNLGTTGARTSLDIGRRNSADLATINNRTVTGTMNLSGGLNNNGIANLALSSLQVGWTNLGATGSGGITGTLTLSASAANHLDIVGGADVVKIGVGTGSPGNYTSPISGTFTIGNLDSTSIIESTTADATAILIGAKPSGATSVVSGTMDFKQGTLTIKTAGTAGAAIAGGGFANTRSLLLGETGMVTLKAGASSTNWIHSLTTAEIKSGGVTFDTNTFDIGVSQAFSGAGGLTKSGAGTLTLATGTTHSYTGATFVSAGTLLVNGTLAGGAVTVDANGTIGGDGIIGGTLHFNTGADLVFNPLQTLTVSGSTVTFGGFDITNLVGLDNTVAQGTYTLIDGAANVDLTNVSNVGIGSAYDLGNGKSAYFQEGSLQLVVIPEPRAALLGGLGLLLLLRRRRA